MPAWIATCVFAVGILGLFALDRDRKIRTSKALWLPVIWIWIIGSRDISVWLGIGPTASVSQLPEGSPLDALVFAVLLAAGIIVLIRRSSRTGALLRANWAILLYFSFCLLSVIWSDFPGVAFKHWIKAIGDLVMVLIVVTDSQPLAALKRFFSRTGFILLPASLLLIKYFPGLGRSYDPWFGNIIEKGVTLGKNQLGVITLVLSLAAVWQVLTLLQAGKMPGRSRHLLAQGVLLAFGVRLLSGADSATSLACFVVGTGLMFTTNPPIIRRQPAAVHALVFALLLTAGFALSLGGEKAAVGALGRNTTLTGRTDIWKLVLPMAPNALVGAGFESFWLGPRLEKLWAALPILHLNEAHDGYIEVYLNLGWVGLSLIGLLLINSYRRGVAAFRRDPAVGSLILAYVIVAALYNITEAGFRMLNPMWAFLLLAAIASGGIASGVINKSSQPHRTPNDQAPGLPAKAGVATETLVGRI
jgi:exopolysaccharide production protein ExoQ